MTAATLTRLSAEQVEELDPYALMAVLGRRVIHPGGREATEQLLRTDLVVTTGPFEMMTPVGFLRDEGLANSARVMGRAFTRVTYLKRLAWLMSKMRSAVPYLGYLAISGTKPA